MAALETKGNNDNGKVKVKTIEASIRCTEGKKEYDVLELVVGIALNINELVYKYIL